MLSAETAYRDRCPVHPPVVHGHHRGMHRSQAIGRVPAQASGPPSNVNLVRRGNPARPVPPPLPQPLCRGAMERRLTLLFAPMRVLNPRRADLLRALDAT